MEQAFARALGPLVGQRAADAGRALLAFPEYAGQRVTEMAYDYRGRVTIVTNPQSPHGMMKYDELNRVTATGQYSTAPGSAADPTTTGTNRVGLNTTAYDERGQVFEFLLNHVVHVDAPGELVRTVFVDAGAQHHA